MRNNLLLFLLVFIAFSGCSNPAGKMENPPIVTSAATLPAESQACPDFFYYYNQAKTTMQINPKILLVGFATGQTPENQRTILASFDEFASLGPEQRSASGVFSIVKLQSGTTCAQALALTTKLQQLPEIAYANPTFLPPQTLGNRYPWIGVTSEFIVTLKNVSDLDAFRKTLAETGTRIVDSLGETMFLVQATKTAKGNALEMANYFHEQPYIQHAEPDFYLASPLP